MAIHIYILLEAENKGDFLNHVQEAVHNILYGCHDCQIVWLFYSLWISPVYF